MVYIVERPVKQLYLISEFKNTFCSLLTFVSVQSGLEKLKYNVLHTAGPLLCSLPVNHFVSRMESKRHSRILREQRTIFLQGWDFSR